MKQVKWFERNFKFDAVQNTFLSILERLAGTPVRLEEKFKSIPSSILNEQPGGDWSIKENLGHLSDLETLWQGRLEDIQNGAVEMRPTDLQNTATTQAHHNDRSVNELLFRFRSLREKTIHLLEGIDEETVFKSALHPRLKTPMRTIDLFLFVAEHDDHHLATISELTRLLKK